MTPASARYRAWRFFHPDLIDEEEVPGVRITTGRTEMVEGQDSVRQAIMMLLTTEPGERVMRPSYGCRLHHLAFAPNDETTAGLAIYYVRQALERWETRIEILDLDAGRDPERPECLRIDLEYRVLPSGHAEHFSLALQLDGANPA